MNAPRTALVTGAARGLGRVFAQALARDGCRVVAVDLDPNVTDTARALTDAGHDALAIVTDLADPSAPSHLIAQTLAHFGALDVVVNNAALFADLARGPFSAITVDTWDRVMAVNLRAPFLITQAASPHLIASGRGRVVNIASGSALRGNAERVDYVASKSGLIGLTRSLARALGPDGVTVNALLPGITATDSALATNPTAHFDKSRAARAIPRVGVPEDLVGALLFLCGPGSAFMTGQSLVVDGGNHML